jgi:hypothetical protein
MSAGRKPTIRLKILDMLRQYGPMSVREMADELGVAPQNVKSSIRSMREAEARGEPRLVYVCEWEFPSRPHGGRENALWALGSKKDKKRPPTDPRIAWNRYERDKRGPIRRAQRLAAKVAKEVGAGAGAASGNPFGLMIAQLARSSTESAAQ